MLGSFVEGNLVVLCIVIDIYYFGMGYIIPRMGRKKLLVRFLTSFLDCSLKNIRRCKRN